MPEKLQIQTYPRLTTGTVYFLIWNSAGQVLTVSGVTFGAYATASLANYNVDATQQGTGSGYWEATVPAMAAGIYFYTAFWRPSGSPAETDVVAGVGGVVQWTGSVINPGEFSIRSGTAQAGASASITLDSGASATNQIYNDCYVAITGGTGAGQVRIITGYVGSTKVASVQPVWGTNPDSTSTFTILPNGQVDVGLWTQQTVPGTAANGVPVVDMNYYSGHGVALNNVAGVFYLQVDVNTIKTNPVVNGGTITFPTGATLASTTNITAGTITTATNLTNAPTSGDFTTAMKTSLNAATPASVVGAVGSVAAAVTVGTNNDKTGYSLANGSLVTATLGTFVLAKTTNITGFNDIAATAVVSGGAIATSGGAVSHVTLVDTCTTNTDMRGTNNAALAATALSTADWTSARAGYLDSLNIGGVVASHGDAVTLAGGIAAVQSDTDDIQTRLPAALVGGKMDSTGTFALDMTAAVPTTNTANTIGDCLHAARVQGFGRWVLDLVSATKTLTLYEADNTTIAKQFTLTIDSTGIPTARA